MHKIRCARWHLTSPHEQAFAAILQAMRTSILSALQVLSCEERKSLLGLTEKSLLDLIQGAYQAYQVCRLCDRQACEDHPVEKALEAV